MARTNTKHNLFWLLALLIFLSENAHAQYVTNGSASAQGGDCYHLTEDQSGQSGNIISAAAIDLSQPFSLSGSMNFGDKDANGADGIVFFFTTSNAVIGGGGGGIGYQTISPSFAWEIDDYQNGNFGDPPGDHMAIMQNGSVDHTSVNNLAGPNGIPNIEDGNDHCFNISWIPSSNTFSASLDGNTITFNGDIAAIVGTSQVYYGFSSGTGALSNLHRICFGSPQLEPMVDITICPGETAQLQADPAGLTYSWNPDPTLTPLNVSNPVATPTTTTTYQVTIGYACGGQAVDDVTVFVQNPPAATASSNSPVCVGETLELFADGGLNYQWSGPLGFMSSAQNPTISNVDLTHAGTYSVTVTDGAGCTGTASTQVVVFPPAVVVITPVFLPTCENADPFPLEAVPPGGTWGGDVTSAGVVDPAALGSGTWTATYTATDMNGCTATDEITFDIVPVTPAEIISGGPFCDTDPPQNLLADPPGGLWGGAATPDGVIVPSVLGVGTFEVTYTFINGDGCMDTNTADIEILAGTTVTIDPISPFCPNALPVTLMASPTGGMWGGAANASGQIDPTALGPGQHLVTYEFSQMGSCPGMDSLIVEVYCEPSASISGLATICEGETATLNIVCGGTGPGGTSCFEPPYTIVYSINNILQASLTITTSPFDLQTNTPGIFEIIQVTSANGCTNVGTGSAIVEVVDAPEISNLEIECDATQTNYSVSFEVAGGDPSTYTVTSPTPGSFTVNPPYIFTSDFIPSGNDYEFTVDDLNGCDPVTISGSFSCLCITDAGTMNLDALTPCADEVAIAIHNGNDTLDADDILQFVIHDGNGNALGTIFGTNDVPTFGLVPPMVPGESYYISAVAGNDDGTGNVDLDDPCLSVSFGTPVTWTLLPDGSLSSDVDICLGEEATIVFSLSGNAPFDVTYSEGTQSIDLENIFDGHTIIVSPATTTIYTLNFVSDDSNPACSQFVDSSVTVTVNEPAETPQNAQICEGESILLGGAMQTAPGVYFDSLSTVNGCDSVIITTLTVNELDTFYIDDSSCDPSQVGTFVQTLTGAFGCDSTVITTVIFSETDTTQTSTPTCDPGQVGSVTQTYTTPDGCDSTVIETFYLVPTDTVPQTDFTCDPVQVGVFTEIFTNQFGCDSVVITDVGLLASDTTELFDTTCDPSGVGVFENIFTNQNGCDSTVILTVEFSEVDSNFIDSETCDPDLAGVFSNTYVTPDGCDSVVIETVMLVPTDTVPLASTTCDPMAAGVFIQNLTNQFGCDSTVIETVDLLPSDTVFVPLETCEPLDTGTVITVLSNQFGCDSTVITTTTLLPPDECGIDFLLMGDTIPCTDSLGSLTIDVLVGQGPYDYEWEGTGNPSDGAGTFLLEPFVLDNLPGGDYSVTVTSADGLTAVVTGALVQAVPPNPSANTYTLLNCHGDEDGSLIAVPSGDFPPYQFSWSTGDSTQLVYDVGVGAYSVTVTGPYGCSGTAEVNLTEPPPLELTFLVDDIDCFDQSVGTITAQVTGGGEPYLYSINGGVFQAENVFTGLSSGTYEILVSDGFGCEISESVFINAPVPIDVELGADLTIELGEGTTLHAIVVPSLALENVTWSGLDSTECPECLDQPVAPIVTTSYSIEVVAENGCSDEDALTVFVDRQKSVYIPNAFSPNGDGINDSFYIFAKPNTVKEIRSFLVFSRWGESIFEYYNFQPNNPAFGWDGRHRGEELNPAVFVYFAEIEFLDGEVILFEGDVNLVK